MSDGHVVIVGAGQGGLQAAMSLRQEGHAGPVTLIGAEDGLPYQRPPLSKDYLKTGQAEKLVLRPAGFFGQESDRPADRHQSRRGRPGGEKGPHG